MSAEPISGGGGDRTLLVEIAASPAAPAIARSALNGLAADHPRAASHLDELALLVSEVVTNAVVHVEYPSDEQIELSINVTDERTRVDVRDPGPGFARRVSRPERPPGGGYGLKLVDVSASRWGAEMTEGQFAVWFEIDHV